MDYDLIKILNEAMKAVKRKKGEKKNQNFVAKYMGDTTKGGAHEAKKGQKASRNRQKKQWKKDEGF